MSRNQRAAVSRKVSDPEFTQRLLRRSFIVNAIQAAAVVALIADIGWRDTHPPRGHYFYTDGHGTPREVYPLDYPVMSDADVAVWTVNSIVAVYTLDFQNYRQQLSKSSEHFTVEGWNSFGTAFINSGNLAKLKEARLVASAQPQRAAVIVHKAVIGDRLTWEIQFPLLVTYENENETHTEHLMVTTLVVRTREADHPDGVAIEEVNAPPIS
jgi:intracellular multiplication protein IcmL